MAIPKMNAHFLEFSKCLGSHDVRYFLIGGHAVGLHGWARNTKDIDFWIAGDGDNQARAGARYASSHFPTPATICSKNRTPLSALACRH